MSVIIQGTQLRALNLGVAVNSVNYSLVTETHTIGTIAGGEVLITSFYAKVTTTMTVANTLAIQYHPTAGDTMTIITATDLGTTDTTAGGVVGLDSGTTAATKFLRGGRANLNAVVTTGTLELVTTGSSPDGAVTFYMTYIPLTAGATLVGA